MKYLNKRFSIFAVMASWIILGGFTAFHPHESARVPYLTPVDNALVLTAYGIRMHPIFKHRRMHYGVDFEARLNTPIFATADGVVSHAGFKDNGFGYYIELNHGNGYRTRYAHLHRYGIRVKEKQKIKAGEFIGLSGNTGRSIGPHLHYEILKKGERVDPFEYLPLGVEVREKATSQD